MNIKLKRLVLGMASVGALGLYGCGGGSSPATNTATTTNTVATTDVSLTVIDGPIEKAKVCLDINNNGVCDNNEPEGMTDANGKVTIKVNSTDVGKYPVIAVVDTNSFDADTGTVPTPFTMKAPADQTAVITPLTTLVHNHMVSNPGSTSAAAADVVKAQTGINVSLFEDFSKGATDDHKAAANIARMVVVTTQQQSLAVKDAEGTIVNNATITKADLDKAIQARLMDMLPALVTKLAENQTQIAALEKALTDAKALINATDKKAAVEKAQKDKDDALKAKMTEVVVTENKGLTKDGVATNVAINKAPVVAETPAAGFSLRSLSFTDASNYFMRFMSSTVTQNTADSKGNVRYVDNRYRSVGGSVASWNNGSDPWRGSDVHWTGTAWAGCALNFESTATVRDADGNSNHNYCDNLLTGKDKRAMFDVSGKKIVDVLTDAAKAGYGTDLGTVTNPAGSKTVLGTVLGDATFPDNSKIGYTTGTDLTTAITYYPGSDNWATVETSTPCAATYTAKAASTLEELLTKFDGKAPCNVGGGSKTIIGKGGVSLTSGPRNEGWGDTVINLGNIGTAATVSLDSEATSFYTGNTRLRAALGAKSGDGGAAIYYACQQRYNGSTRNCDVIGNGNYVIKAVGDARTLSFTGLPALASAMNFTRVMVERGGKVYLGYQARPTTYSNARLNSVASAAMLAKLGLPAVNVDTPLALTPASYQGTWDATPDDMTTQSVTTYTFSATGQVVEPSKLTSTTTVTSFNAATGAFVWKITDIDGYITDVTGKLDFLTGTGTANFSNNRKESGTAKFLRR
jgi:trimeric autotransporter adhesin